MDHIVPHAGNEPDPGLTDTHQGAPRRAVDNVRRRDLVVEVFPSPDKEAGRLSPGGTRIAFTPLYGLSK